MLSCSVVSNSLWAHGLYSLPDPFVHRIHQARILEWVAIPFSRGSSRPKDRTPVSCIAGDSLPSEPPAKPKVLNKCWLNNQTGERRYPLVRVLIIMTWTNGRWQKWLIIKMKRTFCSFFLYCTCTFYWAHPFVEKGDKAISLRLSCRHVFYHSGISEIRNNQKFRFANSPLDIKREFHTQLIFMFHLH